MSQLFLPWRLSIVLRGSIFKGDNFVRFMGDTFARGGSCHTFIYIYIWPNQSEYAISKRGPHYMGLGYFVTPEGPAAHSCNRWWWRTCRIGIGQLEGV